MSFAVETDHLGKRFGTVTAVDDLSLRVTQGEIYAFLGLNGAGKTTTIRMLLDIIKPTSGAVRILGQRVAANSNPPWAAVGYMVETPHAYPELTVRENLEVARRLRPGTQRSAVDRVIQQFALDPYAERRAGTLSQGNAQRLGLAKALLHNPALLILDEPANALDPAGIVEIRQLLRALVREQGVSVFMSSHILGEVARLADRIGIIHQGRLLQELSIEELERNRRRRLAIQARDLEAARAALAQAGFSAAVTPNSALHIVDPAAVQAPDLVATRLVQAGCAPTRLAVEQEDLEHYFLRLVGIEETPGGGDAA